MESDNRNKDNTVKELKSSAQNIRNNARETVEEVRDDLRDTAEKTRRNVQGFIEDTNDELSNIAVTLTHEIHEKPMHSSLIALGLGFFLGVLFSR